jgi:hypothetical protein
VPEQQRDEVRQHEDGFAIFLTPASEAALRGALEQGRPLGLGSGFSLTWLPSTYVDPASGATLEIPSGMRTYQPERLAPRGGAVRVKQTVLLTGEAELRARVTAEDLGDYLEQIVACAEAALGRGAGRGGFEVMVDLKLDPGHPAQLGLMTRGPGVDDGACNDFYRRASALHPPPVRGGGWPCRFSSPSIDGRAGRIRARGAMEELDIPALCRRAREASRVLASLDGSRRDAALRLIAKKIEESRGEILAANALDVERARKGRG